MLWYNNPYHFLTGFVEASVSTGGASQPDKYHGGEHPMWLVTAHSPLLSRRNWSIGPASIDSFFDSWLPTIVDEIRRVVRGPEIAAQMHQEVVSKEGVSRPSAKVGVPTVPDAIDGDVDTPLEELQDAAYRNRNDANNHN